MDSASRMDSPKAKGRPTGSLKKRRFTWFDVLNGVLLTVMALITIFPFYYVVILSLADYATVQSQAVYIIPTSFDFSAYKMVLGEKMFLNAFKVTGFVTLVGTAFSLFVCTTAAYTLSRKNLPFRRVLFTIALIPMYFSGGIIPFYLQVKDLGLFNSVWSLILPAAISTFYLILIKNYFENIPASLEEAARIDGASDIRTFLQIVLPLSKPIIATVTLFFAVDKWNSYYFAMLFITDRSKLPLQNILREIIFNFETFMGSSMGQAVLQSTRTYTVGLRMAVIVVATLPIVIIYPFLQRYFTSGIMLGGVKE